MKALLASIFAFLSVTVWACPNCHDTVQASKGPPWTLIIIGGFILLTYVPFYILFNAARKYDPTRNSELN